MSSENQITSKSQPVADIPNNVDGEKKALRPCCVCKETRIRRDECLVLNGEESCGQLIEAHKKCLREHGFEM